jgi:hypothetical protein
MKDDCGVPFRGHELSRGLFDRIDTGQVIRINDRSLTVRDHVTSATHIHGFVDR